MTNPTKQQIETLKQNYDIVGDGVAVINKNGIKAWGDKLREMKTPTKQQIKPTSKEVLDCNKVENGNN